MPAPFKAYDIRGLYPQELNESLAYHTGNATAEVLGLAGKRFAVGRDMRLSSPALKSAFVKGLTDAGVVVVDVGMVSTPALTFAMHHLRTEGGAQITASHNPAPYGGIKITAPGFKPVDDLAAAERSLRTLLRTAGSLTNGDAQERTGLDAASVRQVLKRLVADGTARVTGAKRGTRYVTRHR